MGNVKRTRLSIYFIFAFIIILILSLNSASASFSVWPAKLDISVNNDFPDQVITYKIQVNNKNPYETNIVIKIQDPLPHRKKEGYTNIPDLSWLKTNESLVNFKAGESKFIDIFLVIPNDQKKFQYNEKWEVWVSFSEARNESLESPETGATLVNAVAVRLFINTPIKEQNIQGQVNFMYLFFVLFIVGIIVFLYMKIKKTTASKKKSSIFYFKRNKKNV